jgi:hypothetical protein
MSNQHLIDTYLARACELEACALRVERDPPKINTSPRWSDAAFLRCEAQYWRAHARKAGDRSTPSATTAPHIATVAAVEQPA